MDAKTKRIVELSLIAAVIGAAIITVAVPVGKKMEQLDRMGLFIEIQKSE